MKLVISSGTLGLAILAALAMPLAHADEWGEGFYIGGDFGRARAHLDDQRIADTLLGPGFVTTSISQDDRDYGWKLFGGYSFNRYIAVEGGYFNLGKFSYAATTMPPGTLSGTSKFSGVNLDLVGSVPLGDHFLVFGRFGGTYGETRNSFAESGAVDVLGPDSHHRGGNYKFGAGLEYDFDHNFGVRAEAERYRVDDAIAERGHIDVFSLGLVYRFGEVAEVAKPAPVAYTPPPQPQPQPQPEVAKCPNGEPVGPNGCPQPPPEPTPEPPKPFRG